MRSIVLVCRQYWNKTNGYMTQSTEIVVDGEFVAKIRNHTSGTEYQYNALRCLSEKGLLPEPYESDGKSIEAPFRYCERHSIKLYCAETAVMRKCDL